LSNPFLFQSPSLRGSGRFERPHVGDPDGSGVSIPFIAGQWSLPESTPRFVPRAGPGFQSPSLRGSGRFLQKLKKVEGDAECLNPLHCGAVVASSTARRVI